MTSNESDAKKTIRGIYREHADGEWEGETPEQLLERYVNKEIALIGPDGSCWCGNKSGDYYDGGWLDDATLAGFIEWLTIEEVK